jgi:hypothetical protein
VKVQALGAGWDFENECGYCGAQPFEAYRRYGLPVGQFALEDHDAVVCCDCLQALRGLHAVGPVTLEALAVQHENWPETSDGESESQVFRTVAEDLVNRIRFPEGTPEDWSKRNSQAANLMGAAIAGIMRSSSDGSTPSSLAPSSLGPVQP